MTNQQPTFKEVQEHEQRLKQMRERAADLKTEEEQLGQEIAKALAAGQDAAKLRAQRTEARELRADLTEAGTLLEQRLAEDREQAGEEVAQKRLSHAIPRAFGSLANEYAEDGKRLVEAARLYAAANEQFNARFMKLKRLEAERGALTDRFGLTAPTLPTVIIPARHPAAVEAYKLIESVGFLDHGHVTPASEKCEHGLRTRRTYREIADTPAGEIIKQAGLKPWPELTERQCQIVESRVRQQQEEAASMDRLGAEAARSTQRTLLG